MLHVLRVVISLKLANTTTKINQKRVGVATAITRKIYVTVIVIVVLLVVVTDLPLVAVSVVPVVAAGFVAVAVVSI